MPVTLLDSQLATLEPLGSDEAGLVVDIGLAPHDAVEKVLAELKGIAGG